jgi:hypothetical protein
MGDRRWEMGNRRSGFVHYGEARSWGPDKQGNIEHSIPRCGTEHRTLKRKCEGRHLTLTLSPTEAERE